VSGITAAVSKLRGSAGVVHREVAKFGAVGAIAFVVNVGLFNILSAGPLDGHEKLSLTIASAVSIVVAWFGSRYWTFRHREQRTRAPFLTFVLMNVIGAGIAIVCLAISHDVFGFTSHLADNISGNLIGVGLGTLFRFWAYRTFVFTEFIDPEGRDRAEDPEAEPLPEPTAEHASPSPSPAELRQQPAHPQEPVTLDERRLAAATPGTGLHLGRDDVPRRAAG
jgi:putative flippase GtrA